MCKYISQFISICILAMGLSMQANGQEVKTDNPFELIEKVGMKTFDRIKAEQSNIENNPEVLRTIVREELLPYVDYRFSAFKVLGKHFKKASKEELQEFVSVFREYLITTYAVALGYYDNQSVAFAPATTLEPNDKHVVVRAIVKDDVRPDIKIAFSLRKDKNTDQWKAYDMVAEGISMLQSKSSEFESIFRQQGVQTVIDLMKDKIEKPIVLKAEEETN